MLVFGVSPATNAFQMRAGVPEGQGWVMAEVVTEGALIHQTPNDAAFVTDEAARGDLLWVKEISPESQWLLVRPPPGAISWIPEADISEIRPGEGRVRAAKSRLRPGRNGARLPGPPGIELSAGTTIWLSPREPLVIPQRQGLLAWRAIEPPPQEPRFVRRECMRPTDSRKEPEPEGFVASKGPGAMSSETPKRDLPVRESDPGPLTKGKRRDDADSDDAIVPQRAAEKAAGEPGGVQRSIAQMEILDIPKSLMTAAPENESFRAIANDPIRSDVEPSPLPPLAPSAPAEEPTNRPMAASPVELPDDPEAAMETLESRFRVIMGEPLVSWDFRPILLACETLGRRDLTPAMANRLNQLRTQAERQEEIGRASRQFWDSMRRSRSQDPTSREPKSAMPTSARTRFDLTGVLLPSRRDVDGQLLYNLIGDSGHTIAYLKMPPAAPVEKWLGKKVGIRGRVRYHEDLRGRLVNVQDVETLEPE